MAKIEGWKKIQDRKNAIAWKSSDGERVTVHKMTKGHWMMGADGMLHVKNFTNKKEALESAVKYMKKSNPTPTKKPKFQLGDKVNFKDESWNEDAEYVVNGFVAGRDYTDGQDNEGGYVGYQYNIKPTWKSVQELSDVEMQEVREMYDNPKQVFFPENILRKGHVKKPGYTDTLE